MLELFGNAVGIFLLAILALIFAAVAAYVIKYMVVAASLKARQDNDLELAKGKRNAKT